MKIRTGSGNMNIIFGYSPEDFSHHELKNLVLWRGNDNEKIEKEGERKEANTHSEIRLKGEGGYIV